MLPINYFHKSLLELKRQLLSQNRSFIEQSQKSLKDSTSELSSYDNHTADLGAETFERSKDLGLKDNIEVILTKVEKALEKINHNTYGICDHCNKSIEVERLQAIPYATLCASCQKREEITDEKRRRPIEEKVISSFRRRYRRSNIEYDREDAWQDVANYGTANTPQDEVAGDYSYKQTYKNEDIGSTEAIEEVSDTEDINNNK